MSIICGLTQQDARSREYSGLVNIGKKGLTCSARTRHREQTECRDAADVHVLEQRPVRIAPEHSGGG
jgi:hypothetical protein